MLRLDHLRLTYPDFILTADWALHPAQTVAIIGPSGAGKSSLLMAVAGFFAPTGGRILWQGVDIGPLPPGKRPVAVLFQDQNLFPHLSLRQNLGLALSPRLRLDDAQRARIDQTLDRLGLAGVGDRLPADLSGGQQGRAALGRVLLQDRPVLLLDEPFAALGPALKTDLLHLVRDLTAETGALTLLVTHDPADAKRFADQTVLVAEGQAMPPQPTAALFADPPAALTAYLGV
jgi:thiamine transport system ATP-binding protein